MIPIAARSSGPRPALSEASAHFLRVSQNLQRVVLDPTGPRENLLVFPLRQRDHSRALVEHHEARAAGALINCANITFQENGSQAGVVAGAFQHTSGWMPTGELLMAKILVVH